jgi:hypothetical protein
MVSQIQSARSCRRCVGGSIASKAGRSLARADDICGAGGLELGGHRGRERQGGSDAESRPVCQAEDGQQAHGELPGMPTPRQHTSSGSSAGRSGGSSGDAARAPGSEPWRRGGPNTASQKTPGRARSRTFRGDERFRFDGRDGDDLTGAVALAVDVDNSALEDPHRHRFGAHAEPVTA